MLPLIYAGGSSEVIARIIAAEIEKEFNFPSSHFFHWLILLYEHTTAAMIHSKQERALLKKWIPLLLKHQKSKAAEGKMVSTTSKPKSKKGALFSDLETAQRNDHNPYGSPFQNEGHSPSEESAFSDLYSPTPEEALYIPNAGIVLLQPYLELFFKELDLITGRQFSDQKACHKAIHLLHYLATGHEPLFEGDLGTR